MNKTQRIKTLIQKIQLTKKEYSICIKKLIFNTLSKLYRHINVVIHNTILINSRVTYQLEHYTS